MTEFPSEYKGNSEDSAGLLFMRAFNRWHGEVKQRLRPLGITHPQFVVLSSVGYLGQNDAAVTQAMVSRISGMDPMSVSQVLTLLEKVELIGREQHPTDSRAKSVILTNEGQEMLADALPIVEGVDHEFFGQLGVDKTRFLGLLQALGGQK